ncbi:MAG: cyclic di-GMP phosphodiesterase [Actinomycetota bacterium]|jgi:putative two-component system response regulator|nr:cyclic di-GMP phosphodiesterase [Actinomycetota bacterium]
MLDKLRAARILLIDDDPDGLALLETILETEGYSNILGTTDPTRVGDLFDAFKPDLVLTDLHMPGVNGLDVVATLSARADKDYIPILVLTGDVSREAKLRALSAGAKDFVHKPYDTTETALRIRNLLETRLLYLQVQNHNQVLEVKVKERTRELDQARIEILERLALASEFRDDATGEHTQRVGRMCAQIAQAMGMDATDVELIRRAAPLHDVGKIGIPDSILLKPGKLTDDEFNLMKRHTEIGSQLLANSISPTLRLGETIALTHHERWDGTGYRGMQGTQIPIQGRILAVADVFDALINERPYKHAWPVDEAIEEIRKQRGRQFDPDAVVAFLGLQDNIDLADPAEPSVRSDATEPGMHSSV